MPAQCEYENGEELQQPPKPQRREKESLDQYIATSAILSIIAEIWREM